MARVYKDTFDRSDDIPTVSSGGDFRLGVEPSPKMPWPKVRPVRKGLVISRTESSPNMPRPIVLSAGKGHVASQNESGPPTIMELFRTWADKLEEMNRRLDRMDNKIEDMEI